MRPDEIKAAVGIVMAAERYGLEVNRKGYASCPFHEEDTPSLKLYPETDTFCCFGCGVGGDVISFVRHLFHLDYGQAVVRIGIDFGLVGSAGNGHSMSWLREKRIRRERELIAYRQEYIQKTALYYSLWKVRRTLIPKQENEKLHPVFAEALRTLDYLDYWFAENHWR